MKVSTKQPTDVTKNQLKEELRERTLIAVYGENYQEREDAINKLLHKKMDFFQGLDLSVILPESHTIIKKYAQYIMDFNVKISLKDIAKTIDDLGNSLGGVSTEQQLKIALDRIKGTLANRFVNHKSDEEIEKDKLLGILRMKHEPNMRSSEYKRKHKNIVVLLDTCLNIVRTHKKYTLDEFKVYLKNIQKEQLVPELQLFITKNR